MAHWYYIGDQNEFSSLDLSQYQSGILWSSDNTKFIAEHIGDPLDTSSYVERQEAITQCLTLIDNPEPEDI